MKNSSVLCLNKKSIILCFNKKSSFFLFMQLIGNGEPGQIILSAIKHVVAGLKCEREFVITLTALVILVMGFLKK